MEALSNTPDPKRGPANTRPESLEPVTAQPEVPAWLANEYTVAVGALEQLNLHTWRPGEEIPSQQAVETALAPHIGWLNIRHAVGARDELVISPAVSQLGLIGTDREPGLIKRYEQAFGKNSLYVWGKLWGQYSQHSPLHDQCHAETFQVGLLLGDRRDPLQPDRLNHHDDEPGLVYAGQGPQEQQQSLTVERRWHQRANRDVTAVRVGQYILVSARHRMTGQFPLDWQTLTRFIHYPERQVGSVGRFMPLPYIPAVNAYRGLVGSRAGEDGNYRGEGIRRVLNIALSEQRGDE